MKSNFKIIQAKGQLRTESFGLREFRAKGFDFSIGYDFTVEAKDLNYGHSKMWLVDKTVLEKSFVIERQLDREIDDCKQDEADGLTPWGCKGEIKLRDLTAED